MQENGFRGQAPARLAVPGGPLTWIALHHRVSASTEHGTTLDERIGLAEEQLYYSLIGLEEHATTLSAEAEEAGERADVVRAHLVASDVASRSGHLERAKFWQLRLHDEAAAWPVLQRRAAMLLATTCDRRGDRAESMHWIRRACADWPEAQRPAWHAEALMVFALMSISTSNVDYSLARHAAAEVEAHASPLLLSVTLANFAEVAAECGDLPLAAGFAKAATSTLEKHPQVVVPLTLDSIARALLAIGQVEAAVALLLKALDLELTLGCTDIHGDPWLSLAEALLIKGDASQALGMMDHPRRAQWAARSAWTRSRDRKQRALILARLHRWEQAFTALLEHVEVYESVRSLEGDRVTSESETRQVADEERRRAARFEQLALTDALTGLPNRRQVDSWLADPARVIHVAIVDLDHFKRVNDNYSHSAGDVVLRRVAETLRQSMFSIAESIGGSQVARLGGEEFVVVWTNVPQDVAAAHAKRLLHAIRRMRYPDIDPALIITASMGLAFHEPSMPGSGLLEDADRALYDAKRTGRDRVTVAASGDRRG